MKWLFLLIAIISEVIGTTALKAADGFTKFVPSAIVVVGYAASFYFFSLTLKTIPVGIAYAIWSGIGVVLIAIIGWVYYHQKLDVAAVVGISLILAGVVVINLLSKSVRE
jgi:small multidrug resistance pump